MAWSVHLLTALGAVAGLAALIALNRGQWIFSFWLMALTIFIDSVDGMCARACHVKEVLPGFDGSLLDNIVDYFTYVIVPASFLYADRQAPIGFNLVAAMLMVLSSAYQFCRTDAKTEDHCFTGFPSYWNIVVFYLFMLDTPPWLNLTVVVFLTIMVFVPVRYLYPSRTPLLRPLNIALTALWGLLLLAALIRYPIGYRGYVFASLAYIVYYIGISFYLTLRSRNAKR